MRKIDHPFVKAVLGEWTWTSRSPSMGEMRGTITYRMGLMDTAVFEDVEGTAGRVPFQGHTVWRVSDDGKRLSTWWFETMAPKPKAFEGTLGADGYDIRTAEGDRMTFARTDAGLELRAYKNDDQPTMTVTFTRK